MKTRNRIHDALEVPEPVRMAPDLKILGVV
jgi:hypothetical protein